jgi:hypothetical protein
MQRSFRDISQLTESTDGDRLVESLLQMIQDARELSWFTVTGSGNSHGILGKVSRMLACNPYKKIERRVETRLRSCG